MNKDAKYWQKREQEHSKYLKENADQVQKDLMKQYQNTIKDIELDIRRMYMRYAATNGMTMQEALKLVSKMDVVEFANTAKKYVESKNFSDLANRELKLYNLKMRISRLKLLERQMTLQIDLLTGKITNIVYQHLLQTTTDEIKRQAGILGHSAMLNPSSAESLVNASFKDATFSQRIWAHQDDLKRDLGKILNKALLQGANPNKFIPEMVKRFNVSHRDTGRILITELARCQGDVQLSSIIKAGYKYYDLIPEITACAPCKEVARHNPHKVDAAIVGQNMYPIHPNCLCSIVGVDEPENND